VKTTIDLDEFKLMRLMDLTGIKNRREAIDYALTEAERKARLTKPLEVKFTPEELVDAVDPDYDLMAMRERGNPAMADALLVDFSIYIELQRSGIDPREKPGPWSNQRLLYQCGMVRAEFLRGLRRENVRAAMEKFRRSRTLSSPFAQCG